MSAMADNGSAQQTGQMKLPTEGPDMVLDPANGPFHGEVPTRSLDVAISAVFLVFFLLTAATHITIYVTNRKRGHKFLPSILIFDFCLDRVLSCGFRILWAFTSLRGMIIGALLVENGTVVILTANLFFFQRTIRAMHPRLGWHPAFRVFVLSLIFSTIAVVLTTMISICVSFMSVGKEQIVEGAETTIRVAEGLNMVLSFTPLVVIFIACAIPGPRTENFGVGPLRSKVSLLVFSEICLAAGAAVRFATSVNQEAGRMGSPVFSKASFYTTAWMLELIVVMAYAYFRVDRLFHIPNGSKGPGDYSAGSSEKFGDAPFNSQERFFATITQSTQSRQSSYA